MTARPSFCAHCIADTANLSPVRMPRGKALVWVCAGCKGRMWLEMAADSRLVDDEPAGVQADGCRRISNRNLDNLDKASGA